MTEESQNLRKSLIATFLNKKSDKIQQKVQQRIDSSFKDWETILNDYINMATKINNMIQLAEQHYQVSKLRHLLKECTELIKTSCRQFTSICDLIELILPMSNLNAAYVNNIIKQEESLLKMKDSLSHVLLFSCNRDVIEVVQKMILQITEIQQKLNFATSKVHDSLHNTLRSGSSILEAANDDDKYDGDEYDDGSITSMTPNNSFNT